MSLEPQHQEQVAAGADHRGAGGAEQGRVPQEEADRLRGGRPSELTRRLRGTAAPGTGRGDRWQLVPLAPRTGGFGCAGGLQWLYPEIISHTLVEFETSG